MHVLLSVLLIAFKFKFWQIYWTSPNRTCIPPPIPKNSKTINGQHYQIFMVGHGVLSGRCWPPCGAKIAISTHESPHKSLMWVADDKDCTWQEQGANWLGAHKTEIHHLMYNCTSYSFIILNRENSEYQYINYRSRIIDKKIKGTIKWLKWCKHNMLHILPCCTDQTLLKDI